MGKQQDDNSETVISVNRNAGASKDQIQISTARSMSTATNLKKGMFAKNNQHKRRIDVWWLDDDGGLTALVPHLIRKGKEWRDCRIEFYGLSKGDGNEQATVRMQAAQARLGHLLKKIRIEAHHTSVDASLAQMPELSTLRAYHKACTKLGFDSELPEGWETDFITELAPTRTSRVLRLAELINQFSANSAAMVFVMLPIPK